MSELGPTGTELEPTATERTQALLDERWAESGYPHTLRPELHKALDAAGIDYWVAQGLTFWNCPDGRECVAYGFQSNGMPMLAVKIVGITDPEQAIAATLGSCSRSNSERTSDELSPCPFCGAKAEVWQDCKRTWGLIEHR